MDTIDDGASASVLREWVVREDLDWVVLPVDFAGVPTLHSRDSACLKDPDAGERHDRTWVAARRREEIEHFEATGERTLYFCELCVIRRVDSAPREHPTGGNPLCPKCFLHHAGDCA